MAFDTKKVLDDAECAAVFFRALVEKGVPAVAAVNLTGSYISSRQITDAQRDRPDEPWNKP